MEDFCGIPDLKTRISMFRKSFMSKTLPNFSKFLLLCKIGPILLLILLGRPRECIKDIIFTEEDFCGIPDLKTRISLFRMSFMSKTLPNFLKILHFCKIGHIMLLILLGGPRECIKDIISTVEDFCGIADWKTRISLFWMSFMSKILPNFLEIFTSLQNRSYTAIDSLGGPQRVYPRHNIHSERLLWDPRFENSFFTDLNEFYVKNNIYFFRNSYISAKMVLYCY